MVATVAMAAAAQSALASDGGIEAGLMALLVTGGRSRGIAAASVTAAALKMLAGLAASAAGSARTSATGNGAASVRRVQDFSFTPKGLSRRGGGLEHRARVRPAALEPACL